MINNVQWGRKKLRKRHCRKKTSKPNYKMEIFAGETFQPQRFHKRLTIQDEFHWAVPTTTASNCCFLVRVNRDELWVIQMSSARHYLLFCQDGELPRSSHIPPRASASSQYKYKVLSNIGTPDHEAHCGVCRLLCASPNLYIFDGKLGIYHMTLGFCLGLAPALKCYCHSVGRSVLSWILRPLHDWCWYQGLISQYNFLLNISFGMFLSMSLEHSLGIKRVLTWHCRPEPRSGAGFQGRLARGFPLGSVYGKMGRYGWSTEAQRTGLLWVAYLRPHH